MNNRKFCFIICTNNDTYLEECIHYINHLIVPEGYEVDLLTIKDAPYITKGYNEGRLASDAKYKIYMHQDVFILNRFLLIDLLDIFNSDKTIGLIGMVGYENVSADGIMWHAPRSGTIYNINDSLPLLNSYQYSLNIDSYNYCSLIDGLFMATAYDLPWDEKEITGWDFYDVYQSINYIEHGYRIAVPNQKHPWCLHDDKKILNMFNYNHYRLQFIQKYSQYLGKNIVI